MMKNKLFVITMVMILLLGNLGCITYAAEAEPYLESVQAAVGQIQNVEQLSLQIKDVKQLYDINLNQEYLLVTFINHGYAIITNSGIISEYNINKDTYIPYSEISDNNLVCVYAGPGEFYVKPEENSRSRTISANILNDTRLKLYDELEDVSQVKAISDSLILEQVSNVMPMDLGVWVGVAESRMYNYRDWKNKDSICGSYASAALLAYYQDYMDSSYIPSYLRTMYSADEPQELIEYIAGYVGDDGLGTTCNMLSFGISRFLYDISGLSRNVSDNYVLFRNMYSKVSQYNQLDSNAIYMMNNNRPCILQLASATGNSYGDHFVLGYQYYELGNYGYYFKVVDNWGSYTATVNNAWVCGWVRIDM